MYILFRRTTKKKTCYRKRKRSNLWRCQSLHWRFFLFFPIKDQTFMSSTRIWSGEYSRNVATETHQHWKGHAMPSINFKKLGKYLGLQTDRTEKVELPRSSRKLYLERIKNSCLNVFQQIRVIKEVISSKILFQLRLLDQEARLGS